MPETRDPALRDRARPRRVGGRWRHICGILDWSTRTPRRDVRREPSARRPARFLLATRHALRQPDRLPARPPRSLAEIPNIGLGPGIDTAERGECDRLLRLELSPQSRAFR